MKRNLADEPVTEAGRSLLASVTVTARNESQLTNWRLAIRAIEAEAAADAIRERDEARRVLWALMRLNRAYRDGRVSFDDDEMDAVFDAANKLLSASLPDEPKAGAIVTVGKP